MAIRIIGVTYYADSTGVLPESRSICGTIQWNQGVTPMIALATLEVHQFVTLGLVLAFGLLAYLIKESR